MRGQSAFEFTILMAFGMILMIILILIGTSYSKETVATQREQALLRLGYVLQDELILATTVQEGYAHDFDLPVSLGRFHYVIAMTETNLQLSSGSQSYNFRIPNTTGTFVIGTNTIHYNGTLSIT